MILKKCLFLLGTLAAVILAPARACDLCGCYTPQLETLPPPQGPAPSGPGPVGPSWTSRFYGAVAEQFTSFNTLQVDGEEIGNPADQYLNSSITQLVGGYTFNKWFALQLNVPLIDRSFRRPEGFAIDRGTESGLGDVSLLGKLVLLQVAKGGGRAVDFSDPKSPRFVEHEPDFTFSGVFSGGVKFPTGDSSRIREEFSEVEVEGAPESGIHGHDLTLGTGSYDGILGGQLSLRYQNFFFQQELQFTLRGDGVHQYHFANDLSWSGGPGYYFVRSPRALVGLQAVVSGEHKDVDRFQGKAAEDTGITSVFLGPRVLASLGKLSAEVGIELPVLRENTALQIVPDYRITGAIALRF